MTRYGEIQRDISEIAHDEMIMKDRIRAILEDGPKTILEIAEEMEYPSYEVTIWLFAMRRYGELEEVGRPDVDGYYQYELVKTTRPAE
ncbi:MAG: MarR family transcriptional regulator [Anaerolineae bacterium]|nr:MarR family transcriptional regulator [Anaerolineae bacterium]